ncbi:MAG TPA: sensor histidine kinase [Bryobacteraceae bacterium]|nr:sensor histidine kinase [Bryobacteraceae bacterium]
MHEQHLVILLVKLAVAASLASILTRSTRFQRMLLRDERTLPQRLQMALGGSAIFGAGVVGRVLTNNAYQAIDLGFEGSLVLGMLGGYVTGLLSGIFISIPAMLNGETMSMPLFAAAGVLGGLLRDIAPDSEAIWRFSPFPDLSVWHLLRKRDLRRAAFSLVCVFGILLGELLRQAVFYFFPGKIFSLYQNWNGLHPSIIAAIYLSTLFATALPLKIWNNMRTEKKLEAQELSLNQARLAALSSQINPHFLFNTLNTVASLIRINPEQARAVVYKLSSILRRLLRKRDNFSPLREELSFIDDYLAIEMVRFGEKLRVVKEINPETLDRLVPSMVLQPLIENSIRHGLASKVDGGTIRLRTWIDKGRLHVIVEDDGVGIPEAKLATLFERGIGVSNINERLKVLFGDDYRMWIDSKPGEGTRTGIEMPEVQTRLAAVS